MHSTLIIVAYHTGRRPEVVKNYVSGEKRYAEINPFPLSANGIRPDGITSAKDYLGIYPSEEELKKNHPEGTIVLL